MTTTPNQKPGEGSQFDALARRAALAGRTLLQTNDGFILAKLTHSKYCVDLDAAKAVIRGLEADFKRGVVRA